MGFHVSEVRRIAHILADDPQLSNEDILNGISSAERTIQQHRLSGSRISFEVHRVRRALALALEIRLKKKS